MMRSQAVTVDAISFSGDAALWHLSNATGGVCLHPKSFEAGFRMIGQQAFLDPRVRLPPSESPELPASAFRGSAVFCARIPNCELEFALANFEKSRPLNSESLPPPGESPAEAWLLDNVLDYASCQIDGVFLGLGPSWGFCYAVFGTGEGMFVRAALIFPSTVPLFPPTVYFLDPIHHVKVGIDGHVRMKLLEQDWNESVRLVTLLRAVKQLITEPELDRPADLGVLHQYEKDAWSYDRQQQESLQRFTNIDAVVHLFG
jgi:hypothetical protein